MWINIASKNFKERASKAISNIRDQVQSASTNTHVGLLIGNVSSILFWQSKQTLSNKSYLQNIKIEINTAFQQVKKQTVPKTYINGLAGLGWAVNFICRTSDFQEDANEILSELDELLLTVALEDLKHNNYDLLYGGVGYGIYFLDRLQSNINSKEALAQILIHLNSIAVQEGNGIFWQSRENQKENTMDFSLAHGQAMILLFLRKLYQNDIQRDTTSKLINGLLNTFDKYKVETVEGLIYPDAIEKGEPIFSPLRWCHGHLGIALALWLTGTTIGNKEIVNNGIQAGLHAAKIRQYNKESIRTAIICHGTLGIAHIFNRFYQYTQVEEFKEAALFWYEESATILDSEIGFQDYNGEGGYQIEHGILNGIQGIGLALLAAISEEEPTWDSCILLS